jgi:mannose-6-phosphate isomerase-like protein (cupin superfamily)
MSPLIDVSTLPGGQSSPTFVGADHGNIPVSFFLIRFAPGVGPELHRHPYAEIFVIEAGEATFQVDNAEMVAGAGQIVIAPAGSPHRFTNTGTAELRLTAIHPVARFNTEWLT